MALLDPATPSAPSRRMRPATACAGALALLVSGCSAFATPQPPSVPGPSLAPSGAVGYVVCPTSVTPVELSTATAEASIALPISGTPVLGNFAIAASPDGRFAYVVTADGAVSGDPGPSTAVVTAPSSSSVPGATTTTSIRPAIGGVRNVVVPIDLATQQAERPISIPGDGATHGIVVLPGGRTVLAASGTTIVPVDTVTRRVSTPIDLGPGHTIFGLALDPATTVLYALVPGGVVPVDTANLRPRAEIPTGLSVSSVDSPHGLVVTGDGTRVYVVGQGGTDFGGRVLPIVTATGTTLAPTGFDRFGIADPAAVAVAADGGSLLVADAANNWVNPVTVATFATPAAPVPLPESGSGSAVSGTQHPSDIVVGPGDTGAFVVDGFDAVIPYSPTTQVFGPPIGVCSGASSMAVAPAP